MSFQKFQTNSYCLGQRHYSGTKNVTGEVACIKKTGKEIKLLDGKCAICDKRKSMIASDNTIKAEGLGDFFKNFGKVSGKAAKKLMHSRIHLDSSKSVQMSQQRPLVKTRKQLYQHYLK